jgi:hypothetical protein
MKYTGVCNQYCVQRHIPCAVTADHECQILCTHGTRQTQVEGSKMCDVRPVGIALVGTTSAGSKNSFLKKLFKVSQ